MARINLDVPPTTLIRTDEEAYELLRVLMRKVDEYPDEFIGFDTETHALKIETPRGSKKPLDWMNDTITYWSLSAQVDGKWYRWCLDQPHFHILAPLLENPKAKIVTWNGKYDAHISWNCGVDVWNSDYMDFQVCAAMLNENLQGRLGLKHITKTGFNNEWRRAVRRNTLAELGYDDFMQPSKEDFYKAEDAADALDLWRPIGMTPFKELFRGVIDPNTGKEAVEYKTSLYDLPVDLVANYASLDAYVTVKLAYHMVEVMKAHKLNAGYEDLWEYYRAFERHVTKVLWRMERRGLDVDVSYLDSLIEPMNSEMEAIKLELNRETGQRVNLNSPKQLAAILYGTGPGQLGLKPPKYTASKQPSTDEEALSRLAAETDHKVPKLIKRHRKLDKIMGTYVEKLKFLAEHYEDGRIHPGFNQYGARTGRFSTDNPNSQNFPNPERDEFGIRKAFVAGPGEKLIVVDYGQLEMRIMAHFSGDEGMLNAIREGKDLHCVTVSKMWGVPYEEVISAKKAKDAGTATPEQKELASKRSKGKTVGFGIIYGAGPVTIGSQLEIPKDEAAELIKLYFKAFPGVKRQMANTISRCRAVLFVETILGRRRNLPEINSNDGATSAMAERESNNSVIQGSAADMAKASMVNCEFCPTLNSLKVELLNQIHDELVFRCPEENAARAAVIIQEYMEHPFEEGIDPLDVPAPVDLKICDCWAEAK